MKLLGVSGNDRFHIPGGLKLQSCVRIITLEIMMKSLHMKGE